MNKPPHTQAPALVTGGAHRVGRAIALALASSGRPVMVHYNSSTEAASRTVEDIRALGVEASSHPANLSDPAQIAGLFEAVAARFGGLGVLVNSASTFLAVSAQETTVEEWDEMMAVNLRAPFLCSQQAARLMGERGGVIVNIADVAGVVPWPRYAAHSVSKAGLIMLTRVLAKSFGPGIRVNAVVPGPVLKPAGMPDDRWERLGERLPIKRTGGPENVGQAVLALVENDYITGAVLNVDGGDSLLGSVDEL